MKVFKIFSQTIKCSKILCFFSGQYKWVDRERCGKNVGRSVGLDLYANKVKKRKEKMKGNFIVNRGEKKFEKRK